ncbi:class I SAM-dependent methyltransferase [Methylobacterium nodulans]|uniref:Methyltransferase type 11 n=1 Tax=Methylobacterium nodulans (strain LMG 21967 / CNCM I-2342 / ORS 2060) TaxID=460265 RepID=B8ILX6_METNO|nr:methyltransferase domain-containing protein [Methylobacterium nodulans]ACL56320.1 Methyltransferase type 11 [Methylobacterium nodulans ORS 2060]
MEQSRSSTAPNEVADIPQRTDPPGIDPLELYAGGIDSSDYVARIIPLLRAAVPQVGDLLDVGAGGGQLGHALRDRAAAWTVIEPAPAMQRRLRALAPPPQLHPLGWREADLPDGCADTVLAANMPAPLTDAAAFLIRCRRWARRTIVWLVPAQQGPRGLCLAGCLPREWHGEDETPGVDIVLRRLPPGERPAIATRVDWTFSAIVPDFAPMAAYLAERLGWAPGDPRRPALRRHLKAQAIAVPGGHRLSVPRTSAILVWRKDS